MTQLGGIWDLDGTLVDTERAHFESWRGLLAEQGKDLDYETFRPTFGRRNDDVLIQFFGFSPSDPIQAMADRKEDLFLESMARDGVRTLPGAAELVEQLSGLGFVQAIASSAPSRNIRFMLERLPFRDCFDAVVSSEEVKHGKPAPDIFLAAAERLGVTPTRSVVFEDAPPGVEAGKAAGCRVVAIAAGFDRETLSAADLVVDSFKETIWTVEQWETFMAAGAIPKQVD